MLQIDIAIYEIQNYIDIFNISCTHLIDIYSFITNSFRILRSLLCQEKGHLV